MNALTIGRELARQRREAGLTQAEVAGLMGTSQAAISKIESGRTVPSPLVMDRFARAIGKPVVMVYGVDSVPSDEERRRRVERALGKNPFNPWKRNPTAAEVKSLLADQLTRERFESP